MKTKGQSGFTLIELMIVVAVVAILAAIAYPSYLEYIKRAHRSDGKAALLSTAQAMERYFTENSKYGGATLGNSTTDVALASSQEKFYSVAFDSAPTGTAFCSGTSTTSPSPTAYRLCATPTGTQTSDTKCGTLSLDNKGIKKPDTDGCW